MPDPKLRPEPIDANDMTLPDGEGLPAPNEDKAIELPIEDGDFDAQPI